MSDKRYIVWCDRCNWNLDGGAGSEKDSRALSRQRRAREKGARLFESLQGSPVNRPTVTISAATSVAFAVLVHVITFSVFVVGAWVTLTNFPHTFAWLVGLPLLLLSVLLRPRLGGIRSGTVLMPADKAVTLYELVNGVAAQIKAKPIDVIALNADFNAAHGLLGLRRRRVLWIGLGLWNALNDRERVALIAHEMAHQVNGDLTYGLIVGTALRTLAEWHAVLHTPLPHRRNQSLFDALEAVGELIASIALRVLRAIVGWLFDLEESMLYSSQQRAEYFADLLSARVASTNAAISALDHLHLARQASQAIYFAVRREEGDVWEAERRYLRELSSKEWERLRRLSTQRGTSIDSTHPPTSSRIELLRRQPDLAATITISAAQSEAIKAELESGFKLVGEQLAERISG